MCSSNDLSFVTTDNDQFNSRQKSVFNELDKLVKSQPLNRFSEEDLDQSSSRPRKKAKLDIKKRTEEYVGCESIFKVPEVPLADRKKWVAEMPDFQINPHKWKRYTLSDVSERDLTERGNTAAAMAFLREHGSMSEPIREESIKVAPKFAHVLKRKEEPIKLSEPERPKPANHPLFQGTKRVMPEYVVGQKAPKKKEKSKPAEVSTSHVKLGHLLDEEDD